MKTVITTLAIFIASFITAAAQNYSGIYYGTYDGSEVACEIVHSGTKVSGVVEDSEGNVFKFSGTLTGTSSKGSMVANEMHQLTFTAAHTASAVTFSVKAPNGGTPLVVKLTKQNAGTTAPSVASTPSGAIDKSLVGSWKQESMLSSSGYGGYGDYASMVSVTYYILKADGTLCVKDGGSVGSGADWNYSAGASNNANCGKWSVKDGYIYITQNGQTSSVKYTMHNGQLVLGTKGNYVFLSRAN